MTITRSASSNIADGNFFFEVTDDALIVTATDEALDPRSVTGMRGLAALEQERRAAEREVNTVRHRERFGR